MIKQNMFYALATDSKQTTLLAILDTLEDAIRVCEKSAMVNAIADAEYYVQEIPSCYSESTKEWTPDEDYIINLNPMEENSSVWILE